jgi:hypothetical protein
LFHHADLVDKIEVGLNLHSSMELMQSVQYNGAM